MNVINRFFLWLALLPLYFYKQLGVNAAQLQAILYTKLLMDDRRPTTLMQAQRRNRTKPMRAATLASIVGALVLGAIYLSAFFIGKNNVTHFLFFFTFFFFMLAASLISDFTNVLIDVRDNYIILPRPVSDATVVTARILHILIHISKLVVPMSLPGLIYIFVQYGFAAAFFTVPLIGLLTLFVIFFINALYLLILRVTTPQRFQSVISYIQIVFAIVIYASYQVLPRMAANNAVVNFDAAKHPAIFLLPVYWFAAGWNALYTKDWTWLTVLFLLLCIAVPVLSLYVVITYLAPAFNNRILLAGSAGAENSKPGEPVVAPAPKPHYSERLGRAFCRTQAERAGFLFVWKMTARSRDFKMKVYPAMGYVAVMVGVMFLRTKHISAHVFEPAALKIVIIGVLYGASLLPITAANQITQSEKYKAAWFFFTTPLAYPGQIISGAVKSLLAKFYLPVFIILLLAGIAAAGPAALPNILLGLINQVLIVSFIVYANRLIFPFSTAPNNNSNAGRVVKNLALFTLAGLVCAAHYLVYNSLPLVIMFALLSGVAAWLIMSNLYAAGWPRLAAAYNE